MSSETYNADDELTAFNGTKLSYDSNGSLTSDGSNSYTWNPLNELASVTTPSCDLQLHIQPRRPAGHHDDRRDHNGQPL